jgi:magnesium-transporting ATPase (P-type)
LSRVFHLLTESNDLTIFIQIELKAEDLYDKEKVDLETILIEDVYKLLQCEEIGLTDEEAARRLEIFGPNRLEHEEQNPFLQASLLVFVFASVLISVAVFEFHVEPFVVGDGSCGSRCHCFVER